MACAGPASWRRSRDGCVPARVPRCAGAAISRVSARAAPVSGLSLPSGRRCQDSPRPAVFDSLESRPRVRAWPVTTCCADWQHVRAGEHALSPRTVPIDSAALGATRGTSNDTRDAARRRHTAHLDALLSCLRTAMTYGSPPRRTRGRVRERSTEQRQAHGGVRSRGMSASQRGSGACASSLGSASQSRSGNDRSVYRRCPARSPRGGPHAGSL